MTIDWNSRLLDQVDFAWEHQFLPRMAGLSDEEFLWEPVAGCWSVRPIGDSRYELDWERPEPVPPPFTTIAWRLHHIAQVFGERASNHFGDGSFTMATMPKVMNADAALTLVVEQHDLWRAGVAALGQDGLERPCGPAEGPFADDPFALLVLHINREFLHHAAEVHLLRDLYAHRFDAPGG